MSNWPNIVTIGSFVADQDVAGDFRVTRKIEGWGTPAIRLDVFPRTAAHGAVAGLGLYAQRTISHEGLVECSTSAAANAVADELAALSPETEHDYVVQHETIGARFCTVRIAVGAEPEWIDDRSFTYGMTLVAEYAFKRAVTPQTVSIAAGTSPTVTVGGTNPAEFEVETTTAGTVSLTVGGMTLSTYSLPAGSVISSMPGRKDITGPAGEDLTSAFVPGSQWPAFVPGANTAANGGTAAFDLTVYDTFA